MVTTASLVVRSACCHCFSSTSTAVSARLSSAPVRMKSMRLLERGMWYSMATPASSGMAGSSTTSCMNRRELVQESIYERFVLWPVTALKVVAIIPPMSLVMTSLWNWLLVPE